MGYESWSSYACPYAGAYSSGNWVSWGTDLYLFGSAICNYRDTRRNQLGVWYNNPIGDANCWRIPQATDDNSATILSLPIGDRVSAGNYNLSVRMYYYTTVAGDASGCRATASFNGQADTQNLSNGWAWAEFEIPPQSSYWDAIDPSERLVITVSQKSVTANTFCIASVCAFQQPISDSLTWVDLTTASNYIATDDYPVSGRTMQLLRNAVEMVHNRKVPRANVLSHWMFDSYDAVPGAGIYGRYRFIKRAGMNELKVKCLAYLGAAGAESMRVSIKTTAGVDISSSPQDLSVNSTSPAWYTATFSLNASETAGNEFYLQFHTTGSPSQSVYLPGFTCFETPGAVVSHTVVSRDEIFFNGKIKTTQYDNLRDSMEHLYTRGGAEICCSDWRTLNYNATSTLDTLTCDTTYSAWGDQFDKADMMINSNCSVVARCILFPSTSTRRLRVRFGYRTTAGSDDYKYINLQLSANESVFATFTCTDRLVENQTATDAVERLINYTHRFKQPVIDRVNEFVADLVIDNTDWESYSGTPEQVWIMAAADAGAAYPTTPNEYIIPLYVMVSEEPIGNFEWP